MLGFEFETSTIETLLSWVKSGRPITATTIDEHTHFYLDKEALASLNRDKELPKLEPLITEKNPIGMG